MNLIRFVITRPLSRLPCRWTALCVLCGARGRQAKVREFAIRMDRMCAFCGRRDAMSPQPPAPSSPVRGCHSLQLGAACSKAGLSPAIRRKSCCCASVLYGVSLAVASFLSLVNTHKLVALVEFGRTLKVRRKSSTFAIAPIRGSVRRLQASRTPKNRC